MVLQDLRQNNLIVEIDGDRRVASIGGVPLALDEREFRLLQALAIVARRNRTPKTPSIAELIARYHVAK